MSEAATESIPAEPRPTEVEDAKPPATAETPMSPTSSVELRYERTGNADDDDDDDDMAKDASGEDEEGAKEEDALFSNIEKEQEGEAFGEQPVEVTAAPRLLQKALTDGEVQPEDSDEEKKDNDGEKDGSDAKQDSREPHVHQRVSLPCQIQGSFYHAEVALVCLWVSFFCASLLFPALVCRPKISYDNLCVMRRSTN